MRLRVICASVVFVLATAANHGALAASLDTEGFKAACVTDKNVTGMPGIEVGHKTTPQAYCDCIADKLANSDLSQADIDMLVRIHRNQVDWKEAMHYPNINKLNDTTDGFKNDCQKRFDLSVEDVEGTRVTKFPNTWDYLTASMRGAPPYFHCDYTSKTCLRGFGREGNFIGEVLAEDRQTVLAHIYCREGRCTNFDTGVITYDSRPAGSLTGDLPRGCVEAMRERHEDCEVFLMVQVGRRLVFPRNSAVCSNKYESIYDSGCKQTLRDQVVIVDKVDDQKACVRAEGQNTCKWVGKNTLITMEKHREVQQWMEKHREIHRA